MKEIYIVYPDQLSTRSDKLRNMTTRTKYLRRKSPQFYREMIRSPKQCESQVKYDLYDTEYIT